MPVITSYSIHYTKLYELVGIGLIGSSLARAARKHGLAEEIVASARTQQTLDTAMRLGLCDRAMPDPAAAVAGADGPGQIVDVDRVAHC